MTQGVTRFYHRTSSRAASQIQAGGFRDSTGSYMLEDFELTGVFVSDVPLDAQEGAGGEVLLEITLPEAAGLDDWELVEEGKPYREWCLPALILNGGHVRVVSSMEEQAMGGGE